jgi:hypothetical protein
MDDVSPEGSPPHDHDPILRIADLRRFGPIAFDPARESESRTDYDDGGVLIRYQYLFDASDRVFVNSFLTVNSNEEEARSTFADYRSGLVDMGFAIEPDDRLLWNDSSATWVVSTQGEQVGHAILVRRGTRTLFVIFTGFFFEGRRVFLELVEPKLKALATWTDF